MKTEQAGAQDEWSETFVCDVPPRWDGTEPLERAFTRFNAVPFRGHSAGTVQMVSGNYHGPGWRGPYGTLTVRFKRIEHKASDRTKDPSGMSEVDVSPNELAAIYGEADFDDALNGWRRVG